MRFYEFVSQRDLKNIEHIADKVWNKLGIDVQFTKHFLDRVNDPRNGLDISAPELAQLFIKEYQQNGSTIAALPVNSEVVLTDLLTSINSPIVINKDKEGKTMVAKTVMRKDSFKSASPMYKVK